jgi:hypothetical protein
MWLSKRALSSVIVASVLALLVGIGLGHVSTMHHEREHFGNHQMRPDFDHDGRGPGMMGPGQGQFGPGSGMGKGQGGPGMMGPGNGLDDDGPGMMGPGQGPDQNGQLPPLPSASAATNSIDVNFISSNKKNGRPTRVAHFFNYYF